MIEKIGNLDLDRELIKSLAKHIHNVNYISCTLSSLKTDIEKRKLIQFLSQNKELCMSEIEEKVIEITRER